MVFCPECGAQNPNNALFCQECGTNLKESGMAKRPIPRKDYFEELKNWWNKQNSGVKLLTIFVVCFVCLILIIGVVGLNYDPNLTVIGLENVVADAAGESHVTINNTTTAYVFHGQSEPNAHITVESEDLNITKKEVKLDNNRNYEYKVKIPKDVSEATVVFEGSKSGREDSVNEVTIIRESSTPQSEETSSSGEYSIGDSSFDITSGWEKSDTLSDSNTIGFKYLKSLKLYVEQISNKEEYNSAYDDAIASSEDFDITTEQKNIEGVSVKYVLANDLIYDDNYYDYFFIKNGKYYHISVVDTSDWKSISADIIPDAVSKIIKTIQ